MSFYEAEDDPEKIKEFQNDNETFFSANNEDGKNTN